MKKSETLQRNSGTSNNIVFMPYYDKQFLEKLNELSIESVAVKLGLTVKKHWALCPWHSDHNPSLRFSTNSKENFCHCFVCGKGGNPISLTMQVENCGFQEACQILAREFSIPLPNKEKPIFVKKTPPKKKVVFPKIDVPEFLFDEGINTWLIENAQLSDIAKKFLFEERHFKIEVIQELKIKSVSEPKRAVEKLVTTFGEKRCIDSGLVKKGDYGFYFYFCTPCLLFPYYEKDGRLIGVQSRYLGERKDAPRFQFMSSQKTRLFNLPMLNKLKWGDRLYISEGITDCLALLSSGMNAVAIPSATIQPLEDLVMLKNYDLHMYPDQDEAGRRAFVELRSFFVNNYSTVKAEKLPEGMKDYCDYYVKNRATDGK